MVELASQPTVIQSIYGWYRESKILVNRRYQRKLVWTLEEKQKLIESILKRYPVPAILLAEKSEKSGSYEVIDGLQRLHAIVSFIEQSFPTIEGNYFDISQFSTAKSYADGGFFIEVKGKEFISSKEVSTFLDYPLAFSIMRNATNEEINDVFDRINTYGHRLSDQERRQSGIQNEFSNIVRNISCQIRGDVSKENLTLFEMPSISIDLPKSNHGYEVKAEEVFWVMEGILRATDLRDSMDEQCVADICACIITGKIIERSKDALDLIYDQLSAEYEGIMSALAIYGSSKVEDEFKYCISEIKNICAANQPQKLRAIMFSKETTNPFPSVFSNLFIAIHELVFVDKKIIADYLGIKKAIDNISDRLETTRKATMPIERRKNIDAIKGIIGQFFVKKEGYPENAYKDASSLDIDNMIRRSIIELPSYELKQGCLLLDGSNTIDKNIVFKILCNMCAIANNGPDRTGYIILGICDKEADAKRIRSLHSVEPRQVGQKFVVGINREAKALAMPVEKYFHFWRDSISKSDLSTKLKTDILSHIDYNNYFGLGIIIVKIVGQNTVSFVGDDVYYREGDQLKKAESAKIISEVVARFK